MQKVMLFTNDGHLVKEAEIPPFQRDLHPQVIIWGNRVFRHAQERASKRDGLIHDYVEVFAYVLPDFDLHNLNLKPVEEFVTTGENDEEKTAPVE